MDRRLAALVVAILNVPLDALMGLASAIRCINDRLPHDYLATLNDQDKLDAVRACLTVSLLTDYRLVCQFQLEASLTVLHQRDSVIIAGADSGKTLCLLIPLLLRPGSVSITVSPLKRLQMAQVLESERYGIKTIAINEDTPHDEELWKSIRDGTYRHLIVLPEQLVSVNGHYPRLARLLRESRPFVQRVKSVHIDEAHNIHTVGVPHHGEDAFRPAYGELGLLRIFLPRGVPIQALSATLPDHILATVKDQLALSPNSLELRLSTNRPNIMYATLPIAGNLRNFNSLSFLIPAVFHPPMVVPKTLIFHDSVWVANDAARFMESNLPSCLRNRGLVKHYHSDMSIGYLQQTFEDFSRPDGACRILHATAGAVTGLDIRGVSVVIQYGICQNMVEVALRARHVALDHSTHGLFLIMVEQWALDLPLGSAEPTNPDQAYIGALKRNDPKQDRTSVASLRFVQSASCLRACFASFLGDNSPEALYYTAPWCCDRHDNADFVLGFFFHGKLQAGIPSGGDILESDSELTERKRTQMRPLKDRQDLFERLLDWRDQTHSKNRFFPCTWLMDDNDMELVSETHPSELQSLQDLITLLGETEEWANTHGAKVLEIITTYDQSLQ